MSHFLSCFLSKSHPMGFVLFSQEGFEFRIALIVIRRIWSSKNFAGYFSRPKVIRVRFFHNVDVNVVMGCLEKDAMDMKASLIKPNYRDCQTAISEKFWKLKFADGI
ncbi:hypothetical protein Dimus_019937 [Dionaea muscipula]